MWIRLSLAAAVLVSIEIMAGTIPHSVEATRAYAHFESHVYTDNTVAKLQLKQFMKTRREVLIETTVLCIHQILYINSSIGNCWASETAKHAHPSGYRWEFSDVFRLAAPSRWWPHLHWYNKSLASTCNITWIPKLPESLAYSWSANMFKV